MPSSDIVRSRSLVASAVAAGLVAFFEGDERPLQDDGIGQRRDRQAVLVVPDAEAALLRREGELEVPLLQRVAVAVAQHRHDELAVGAQPLPVDVEGAGLGRELPPLQHREPPAVVGAADAHVVRHDVEDEAQAVLAERIGQAQESLLAAELQIDRRMVDDVVAVGGAGPRLVDRRGVEMADPEPREIRNDLRRVVEGEVLVELEPVGGARRGRRERSRARVAAAPFRCDHRRDFSERPAGCADRGEVLDDLAPPVRMLFAGAREVRLIELPEHVLVLDRREHAAGTRQVAHDGLEGRRLRGDWGIDQAFVVQCFREPLAFDRPAGALALGGLGIIDADGLAQVDVEPAPPADESGQVVGGEHGQRPLRIGLRRLERPALGPLEGLHPVAQHPRGHDGVREALGGRAEVLGDHEAALPVALQAQDREERLEGEVRVGPLRRGGALRDQEQALELEGVVDADRARVAHVGHHEGPEAREPLGLERQRVEGRQAPVLALRSQGSGGAPTDSVPAKLSGCAQISDPPASPPTARSR
jgi:hypothetical protein